MGSVSERGVAGSYHTHNEFCDGTGRVNDMVEAALAAGLSEIGISSHAPLPFETGWAMPAERLQEYIETVSGLARIYSGRIDVLLGLEVDYIPDPTVHALQQECIPFEKLDFVIGSVHYLGDGYPPRAFDLDEDGFRSILDGDYAGSIRAMVSEYYRRVRAMLQLPRLTIVGHIDRIRLWNGENRYFRQDEDWYVAAVEETLYAIRAAGTAVELNTGGWRKGVSEPFPSLWVLRRAAANGIPVIVNSDAHRPDQVVWGFDRALDHLEEMGVVPSRPTRSPLDPDRRRLAAEARQADR